MSDEKKTIDGIELTDEETVTAETLENLSDNKGGED